VGRFARSASLMLDLAEGKPTPMDNSGAWNLKKLSPRNPLAMLFYAGSMMAGGAVWAFIADVAFAQAAGAPPLVAALTHLIAPLVEVAGGIIPDTIKIRFINRFTRDDLLRNGELGHAVGEAVCAAIHEAAKGAKFEDDREALRQISGSPEQLWEIIRQSVESQEESGVTLTAEEIKGISPEAMTRFFSVRAEDFDQLTALSPEVWGKIIAKLRDAHGVRLWEQEKERLAELLYRRFPYYLKRALVSNPAGDWKAFVSLQTQLFGEVIADVKEINEGVADLKASNRELSSKLDEVKEILAAIREGRADDSRAEVERITGELHEMVARRDRQLRVYEFRERALSRLRRALDTDTGSTFFRKYLSKNVYLTREEAQEQFDSFLEQADRRCFVVVGDSGNGKTCLLCRLAESVTERDPALVPLLVSADELSLTSESADELQLFILDRLGFEPDSAGSGPPFAAFGEFLQTNGLQLVVFFDALNELRGRDSVNLFNAQFDRLLRLVAVRNHPVRFAATCGLESWQQFNPSSWARDHVFRQKGSELQATCTLDMLSLRQLEDLAPLYFFFFAVEGELAGEAKNTCRTPLMLRILCDTYTKRPPDDKKTRPRDIEKTVLNEITSFRKKEVLKKYATARREGFVEFTRRALRRDGTGGASETVAASKIYYLTTLYILHIANFMYERRQNSITAREVCEVAARLGHPDAELGPDRVASDPSSFFLQLIDVGVFSRKPGRFDFLYETYFEFSLGRYIAFVRWKQKAGEGFDLSKIADDMEALIAEHAEASRRENFSNLFGAIHFAVLATETRAYLDQSADETPVEERTYYEHPELFVSLVGRMADARKGFDWLQQACLIIREAELSKRENWERLRADAARRRQAEQYFGRLLRVLDALTKDTDFVVLWDLGNTLEALAAANFDLTLTHIEGWVSSDERLRPVFAAQVLAQLAPQRPDRVIRMLLEWIRREDFRSNFWLTRSLLFSVSEIARLGIHDGQSRDWSDLREEVFRLASAASAADVTPYIRGRALSLLPLLGGAQPALIERMRRAISEVSQPENSWQLWSLAYELRHLPEAYLAAPNDWLWETLAQIAENPNDHVRYVVDQTFEELSGARRVPLSREELQDELKKRLRPSRWRAAPRRDFLKQSEKGLAAVVYTPAYLEPDYENHVECRERLLAIVNRLEECGQENFAWVLPEPASEIDLRQAHGVKYDRHRDGSKWLEYVETVKAASERVASTKGPRSRVGPSELRFESYDIALLAAGGVIRAIDHVLYFESPAAFVLNRPPGHLANNTICIFNNVAIGARHALDRYNLERVLIVDFDAHHGKHTQEVFLHLPEVLYFSTHIDLGYSKETGKVTNTGEGEGEGYTFNVPFPPRMGDEGYRHVVDRLLVPVALDFRPQLILVSAGFDAHFDDPLTPHCHLTDDSFVHLAKRLKEVADECGLKIVAALEGGYGLAGMSNSLAQMLNVWGGWGLEGKIKPTPLPPTYGREVSSSATEVVRDTIRQRLELMRARKASDGRYFFNPAAPHWGSA
jgi:acetoin utilization deacetylase AcuC-like enzyme